LKRDFIKSPSVAEIDRLVSSKYKNSGIKYDDSNLPQKLHQQSSHSEIDIDIHSSDINIVLDLKK